MKNQIIEYMVDDFYVRTDGDLVNLNDIYVLAGSPKSQDPWNWKRTEGFLQLLDSICKNLNLTKSQVYKSSRGRYSTGTWAHKLLAVEYSGYLSPDLRLKINDTFLRVQSGDTSVIEETLDRQSPDQQKRTLTRMQGKITRNLHTATLQAHGVHGAGFAQCTNATYQPLLGGTASEIREKHGLAKTANVREVLSQVQLASLIFSEALSTEDIEVNGIFGNKPCATACLNASTRVARAFNP